ncbi:MAG: CAP domain-containing protein [Candidatus Humimicrobiaceae bacterium]
MKKRLLIFLCAVVLAVALIISTMAFVAPNGINVLGAASTNSAPDGTVIAKDAVLSDYENQVAALINNFREANGLNALAADESLTNVAMTRSRDLLDRNYFSHYTPEGTNVFNLMRDMGIEFRYAGENLAQSAPASVGTPEGFLNAWVNSPSHRDNILRSQYTKIGVAMVEIDSRRVVATVFTN